MLAGKIEQRVLGRVGFEDNASAVTAVAAIGPALGNVFFAAERDAPHPAVAGLHVNDCFINKHIPNNRAPRRGIQCGHLAGFF